MNKQAYLIGFINKRTLKLNRVLLCSEFPVAQMDLRERQVELTSVYGPDFHTALKRLKRELASAQWHWLVPLLSKMRR